MTALQLNRLEKKVERIERLLDNRPRKKKMMIPASTVCELTGWDKHGLEKARKYGYIKYEKEGKGFLYELESIHDKFLVHEKNRS